MIIPEYIIIPGAAGIVFCISSICCYIKSRQRKRKNRENNTIAQGKSESVIDFTPSELKIDMPQFVPLETDVEMRTSNAIKINDNNIESDGVSYSNTNIYPTVPDKIRELVVDELVNKYIMFSAGTVTREELFKKYDMFKTSESIRRLKNDSMEIML